ncbi:MAG: sigma-54-dependent transcriptional regulator [Aquificaceae bacterium]|jgi:two-component system NtrC family response regulator|uniref:sigma-54-dependent transcriptional regulator n=1 Tax=Hydrogenobacter sp. Uz 6-8 TaxID=3384828 RepID=UPI0030962F66
MEASILVVDDERSIRETLRSILEEEGYRVFTADSIKSMKDRVERSFFHCVLLDLWLPDGNGLEYISYLKEKLPGSAVIVITGHGKTEHAVRAVKEGAYDFLEKPFSMDRLITTVERSLRESIRSRREEEEDPILGNSRQILQVKELISKVAPTGASILILGESGTGKELVARRIHSLSERSEGPFVDINCAGLPDELVEAELFGYEKGAFTSASQRKLGKIELAHGGTLFLDEVSELSQKAQAKLLRVIETREFTRLGGNQVIRSDFRLVCATNKNLQEEVKKGNFREDLYHRISTFVITLPPLRERGEDIALLAEHFLSRFLKEYGKPPKYLSEGAKRLLETYQWKGNVRELKNLMERLAILHEGTQITEKDLRSLLGFDHEPEDINSLLMEKDLRKARQGFERLFIERKLREYGYDLKKTAEAIGIDLSNLYRKIRQYEIEVGI